MDSDSHQPHAKQEGPGKSEAQEPNAASSPVAQESSSTPNAADPQTSHAISDAAQGDSKISLQTGDEVKKNFDEYPSAVDHEEDPVAPDVAAARTTPDGSTEGSSEASPPVGVSSASAVQEDPLVPDEVAPNAPLDTNTETTQEDFVQPNATASQTPRETNTEEAAAQIQEGVSASPTIYQRVQTEIESSGANEQESVAVDGSRPERCISLDRRGREAYMNVQHKVCFW